jgi:hypothetical protein
MEPAVRVAYESLVVIPVRAPSSREACFGTASRQETAAQRPLSCRFRRRRPNTDPITPGEKGSTFNRR